MTNYYSNLLDSVLYNRKDPYRPKNYKMEKEYYSRLDSLLIKAVNGSICLGLTLNQISDNPIFYNEEQSPYYERLKAALKNNKAFISTFRNYNVVTYAQEMTLESFKREVGDEGKQYISSIISDFKVDLGQDKQERLITKAFVGASTPIKLSGENPDILMRGKTEMSVDEYLDKASQSGKAGIYQAIKNEDAENLHGRLKILHKNVWDIHRTATENDRYRPNAGFVNENNLNILIVLREIVSNEKLLGMIFDATIAGEIPERKREMILEKIKDAFYDERIDEEKDTKRSALYKHIPMLCEYFKKGWGIGDQYYSNEWKNSVTLFIWQLICFAYNYYNSLLVFGSEAYTFEFVPFRINNGSFGAISDTIFIKENLFEDINRRRMETDILYRIEDGSGKVLGQYTDFGSAKDALPDKPDGSSIVDRKGYILMSK